MTGYNLAAILLNRPDLTVKETPLSGDPTANRPRTRPPRSGAPGMHLNADRRLLHDRKPL
jgi:hypothetical protein